MGTEMSIDLESKKLLEKLELAGEERNANFLAENKKLIVELATKNEFFYKRFKKFFKKYADPVMMMELTQNN